MLQKRAIILCFYETDKKPLWESWKIWRATAYHQSDYGAKVRCWDMLCRRRRRIDSDLGQFNLLPEDCTEHTRVGVTNVRTKRIIRRTIPDATVSVSLQTQQLHEYSTLHLPDICSPAELSLWVK